MLIKRVVSSGDHVLPANTQVPYRRRASITRELRGHILVDEIVDTPSLSLTLAAGNEGIHLSMSIVGYVRSALLA